MRWSPWRSYLRPTFEWYIRRPQTIGYFGYAGFGFTYETWENEEGRIYKAEVTILRWKAWIRMVLPMRIKRL